MLDFDTSIYHHQHLVFYEQWCKAQHDYEVSFGKLYVVNYFRQLPLCVLCKCGHQISFIYFQLISLLTVSLWCTVAADRNQKLETACPNTTPPEADQPLEVFGQLGDDVQFAGLGKNVSFERSLRVEYVQYHAALSLTPCDSDALSVFTPATRQLNKPNPNDKNSVAVIFTE